MLLSKFKLNSLEVLIFNALNDSNVSHDQFLLINNVSKEFDDIKEEIKNSNDKWKFKIYKTMSPYCLKCRKNTESKYPKFVKTKNGRIMLL